MARKPNYGFERNARAKAKAAKREAKRQAKLANKEEKRVIDTADGEDEESPSEDAAPNETVQPQGT